MNENLFSIIERFSGLRVAVIGEAILESYIIGSASRLNLEAPAPVVGVTESIDVAGGAASVAVSARGMGADVTFLSVIGRDLEGEALLQQLRSRDISVSDVMRRTDRRTLLRRRIYADSHLLVRYDQGSSDPVGSQTEDLLLEQIRRLCPEMDAIIVSDYGAGLITPRFLEGIARIQTVTPCVLVADTRRIEKFSGVQLAAIRPSALSALEMVSNPRTTTASSAAQFEQLSRAGEAILSVLDTQLVAITLDTEGAVVFEHGYSAENSTSGVLAYRTYGLPLNKVDGAGDAFVAGLTLALAAGADAPASAEVASAAAALVVRGGGKSTRCTEDIRTFLAGEEKMITDRAALAERVAHYRQEGRKIVFTNGCFDILRSGHVAYLNQAKSYGDVLIIGMNTDESVLRQEGSDQPTVSLEERMRLLAGLSSVDLLIPFGEDNPIPLIEIVRPDFYVKGGDTTRETLPETPVVEKYGGQLVQVPYQADRSTSLTIRKIRQAEE